MGGSITVRSKVNEGSMFSFTLPLQVAEQTSSSTGQTNDNLYSMMSNEQEHSFDRRSQDYSSFRKSRVYPDFAANSNVSSTRPRFSRPDNRRPNPPVFSTGTEVQSLPSTSKMNRRDTERNIASGKPILGPLPKAKTEGRHIGASKSDRSSPTKSRHTVNSPEEDSDFRMNNTSTLDSMLGQSLDPIGTRTSEGGQASTGQTSLSKPPSQTGTVRGSRKSTEKGPVGEREGVLLQGSGTQQRPARILLVEDNKVNVMVAQSMLMKLGHTLEVANNGADAIQALQQNSYDLILMVLVPPMPSHALPCQFSSRDIQVHLGSQVGACVHELWVTFKSA
jgi:CheY-like chemotaxis protein